jgi:arylsulfatase A-like enzyme
VSFPGQGVYLPEQAPGGVALFNVNGEKVPQKGYITDELTDYTIDWLRAGRDDARPFFLHLAHKAIHVGFTPAARHKDRYQDLLLAPPPTYADTAQNYAGKPRWVRAQRNSWHGVDYAYYVFEGMAGLAKLRRRYLETLLAVDDSVGRILAELEALGLERRTVVLLMGDNGFLFGEHGLVDKRHAYEDSIRIPLLAYAPGRFPAGTVVEGLVSNLDIAPTILDLAGVARPEPFEGRSFVGLTTGAIPEAAWRGELVYEYYWEPGFPQTPTTFALRTDRWKYIFYHGIWEPDELYDLQADPLERRNLAAEPELQATRDGLRERLFAALVDARGERVIPIDAVSGPGRVYRSRTGAGPSEFPPSWLRGPGGKP